MGAGTVSGGIATVLGGGTLDASTLVGSGVFGVTLSGFAIGDTANLTNLGFVTSDGATPDGLLLSVTEGGTTDTLTFTSDTNFGGTAWTLAPDGNSGTDVTLVVSSG